MKDEHELMKNRIGEGRKYVIDGRFIKSELFIEFEQDCCKAYNIIRREGKQLINLFLLMMSAGMPELNSERDLKHLVDVLKFDYTDQEASMHFKRLINEAMDGFCMWRRRIDNLAHNAKQVYG